MRKFQYWFVEGQTHFGMPEGAKMSLAPNEQIQNILIQTSTPIPSMHAPKIHQRWKEIIHKANKSRPKL
jgi:hypothetical protein